MNINFTQKPGGHVVHGGKFADRSSSPCHGQLLLQRSSGESEGAAPEHKTKFAIHPTALWTVLPVLGDFGHDQVLFG